MSNVMFSLMVRSSKGWRRVAKSESVSCPSEIGVQIGDNIVYLGVGDKLILKDKQVKTAVNKGLCALGFYTKGYYPESHSSGLAHESIGVGFVIHHNHECNQDGHRKRSGGLLERIA